LYNSEIEKLIYIYIIYIFKEDFLSVFQTVFCIAITESNIKKGFWRSGLVLFDPEYIISQLDIQLSNPILLSTLYNLLLFWELQTLSNIIEIQSQSTYIKKKLIQYQNSSSTLLLTSVDQFAKSAIQIIYQITLLQEENLVLCKANNKLSLYCCTKKHWLQNRGSLTVGEAQALQAQYNVNLQLQADLSNSSSCTNPNLSQLQQCRACSKTGYNVQTCQNNREMSSDSDSDFN